MCVDLDLCRAPRQADSRFYDTNGICILWAFLRFYAFSRLMILAACFAFSFSALVFAKGATRSICFSLFGFFGHSGTELATRLQSRTWVSVSLSSTSLEYILKVYIFHVASTIYKSGCPFAWSSHSNFLRASLSVSTNIYGVHRIELNLTRKNNCLHPYPISALSVETNHRRWAHCTSPTKWLAQKPETGEISQYILYNPFGSIYNLIVRYWRNLAWDIHCHCSSWLRVPHQTLKVGLCCRTSTVGFL